MAALGFATAQRKFLLDMDVPVVAIRQPYVQNVRTDRANIMWATQSPGAAFVEFTSDGRTYKRVAAQSRVFFPAETGLASEYTQYTALLSRLAPNTAYVYYPTVNGEIIGTGTQFRTAGAGPFKFLVLGDSGMGTPEQARVAAQLAKESASFLLHVGDIAYGHGNFAEFQRFHFDVYGDTMSRLPFFTAPGNHEYATRNAMPYMSLHCCPSETVPSGEKGRYYSFDWGNVHFVSLDSNSKNPDGTYGALGKAIWDNGQMLNWLDRDLKSTRQFWRIVFFHHPAYAGGTNMGDPNELDVLHNLIPILEANGVQLVFNGHEHNYQRTFSIRDGAPVADGTGTVYVTSGGGGGSRIATNSALILYNPVPIPQSAVQNKINHYVKTEVNGLGLTIRAISDIGIEFDTITIKPAPVVDSKRPVTFDAGGNAGSLIHIRGWNLASQEVLASALSATLAGTSLVINEMVIPLVYVSPTQVTGLLPIKLSGSFSFAVFTPNGRIDSFWAV
jgi:hypothetical protein